MPKQLSADHQAGRQGPELSAAIGEAYRKLPEHKTDVALKEFMRLVARLVDAEGA